MTEIKQTLIYYIVWHKATKMEWRKRMEHDKYDYAYVRIDFCETYLSR